MFALGAARSRLSKGAGVTPDGDGDPSLAVGRKMGWNESYDPDPQMRAPFKKGAQKLRRVRAQRADLDPFFSPERPSGGPARQGENGPVLGRL